MDVRQAYNIWAEQYDSNSNKTRDLESHSLKSQLTNLKFSRCLEIGCGTGKNTGYLLERAEHVTAVDLSEEMLAKAKQKIKSERVQFIQADINTDWSFITMHYDLVTFSLVLEHIENLSDVFKKVSTVISTGGYVYIGELHPFKQYTGTKARFETENGLQIVTCFNHHVSDFVFAAKENGFEVRDLTEYFDDGDRSNIPRILTLLLQNNNREKF